MSITEGKLFKQQNEPPLDTCKRIVSDSNSFFFSLMNEKNTVKQQTNTKHICSVCCVSDAVIVAFFFYFSLNVFSNPHICILQIYFLLLCYEPFNISYLLFSCMFRSQLPSFPRLLFLFVLLLLLLFFLLCDPFLDPVFYAAITSSNEQDLENISS